MTDTEHTDHQGSEPLEASSEQTTTEAVPLEERMPTLSQLFIAIVILAGVLGSSYVPELLKKAPEIEEVRSVEAKVEEKPVLERKAAMYEAFDGIALEAEAAYVWDVKEQRALYTKNASAQLPLASLTKLMTALIAYDVYGKTASIPITLSAISQEGENGFIDGEVWNSKSLLDYTLLTSSNDGAYALAAAAGTILSEHGTPPEAAFLKRMNMKAEQIGLSQTYFTNPTGLDTSEAQSGSYGSARDMAFLMEYILREHPELLAETRKSNEVFYDEAGNQFAATNTNQAVQEIPNLLGSKTGYTLLAGGNLVVAFDAGIDRPIVISVLGSSREGRFSDVLALVDRVEKAMALENI